MSRVIESEPWGYESEHPYKNVGVTFVSNETPEDVLDALQQIERELGSGAHRTIEGGYADRIVDIDIIAVDEQEIATERLKVPHPRLAEREFFLTPMVELAPLWRHPRFGQTPEEMLETLNKKESEEDHDNR